MNIIFRAKDTTPGTYELELKQPPVCTTLELLVGVDSEAKLTYKLLLLLFCRKKDNLALDQPCSDLCYIPEAIH